jgi:hypothetical protein
VDAVVELADPRVLMCRLERLDEHSGVDQGVAQVRARVAAVLPGAPGRAAQRHSSALAQNPAADLASAHGRFALALPAGDQHAAVAAPAQLEVALEAASLQPLQA